MTLTLDNFEKKVPAEIRTRGFNYYRDGHITFLDEVEPGEWEAIVTGSQEYTVDVSLDGKSVDFWDCDCPYDQSDVCKHVVAVLFELRRKHEESLPAREILSRAEILAKARAAMHAGKAASKQPAMPDFLAHINPDAPKEKDIAPLPKSPEKWYEKVLELPDFEQHIVYILALSYSQQSLTSIVDIARAAQVKPREGLLSTPNIQPVLHALVRQGIIKKEGISHHFCPPEFAGYCAAQLFPANDRIVAIVLAIKKVNRYGYWEYERMPESIIRDIYHAFLNQDFSNFNALFYRMEYIRKPLSSDKNTILNTMMPDNETGIQRLRSASAEFAVYFLKIRLDEHIRELTPVSGFYEFAKSEVLKFAAAYQTQILDRLIALAWLRGDWELFNTWVKAYPVGSRAIAFAGAARMFQGDQGGQADADTLLTEAEKLHRKETRSTVATLQDLAGLFRMMNVVQMGSKGNHNVILKTVKNQKSDDFKEITRLNGYFNHVVAALQNDFATAIDGMKARTVGKNELLNQCFYQIFAYWISDQFEDESLVEQLAFTAEQNGYQWVAGELRMLQTLKASTAPADDSRKFWVQSISRSEDWVNILDGLLALSEATTKSTQQNDSRLIWLVDFEHLEVEAKIQTYGKKGWTAGRALPYSRQYGESVEGATEQDKKIIALAYSGWRSERESVELWKNLVGHPLLFLLRSPGTAVQFNKLEPVLLVKKVKTGYEIRLDPPVNDEPFRIIKETPTRYLLYCAEETHLKIDKLLGRRPAVIPEKGLEHISRVISSLSSVVTVQSGVEEIGQDKNIQEVKADHRPCVHLLPMGNGFHVEIFIKPFAPVPPYFKPGEGESIVFAVQDGQKLRTIRDLKKEKKAATQLRDQITWLHHNRPSGGVWEIEDGETCLELLAELYPLVQTGDITVEWPKGEKYKITSVVGFDQFKLQVSRPGHWFQVTGELRIDENRVMSMQELLELSEKQKSPFIELGPGQFLAITAGLRNKLRAVSALLSADKKGHFNLHPLAASAFQPLVDATLKPQLDEAFLQNREKLQKAFAAKFKVPASFKADLRPYQTEGFEWLHKMAAWGAGACLADDMGLGKTIQALAFLTDRASMGPALVVAPVSVCRNWVIETQKFAPKLTPLLFGEGDRESVVKKAKKGDLVIATYDLLTRESALFTEKKWATIILDEAQAIKNRNTKRSDVAMSLQADFRMIMSGTPLENHLGELWNLFQFANPGLLGSIDQFNERFAIPIEKYKDESRRDQLKRLVQPFILRRRKDEVLKDLPPKTEITLRVELTPEETAFYEALRRKAIQSLENQKLESDAGAQHLQILAEISKLRRAACHPKLADENAGIAESSKQRLFGEIVDELLENGHRALVFSQFVSHLAILKNHLDQKNIPYHYLDGQTPSAKRQKSIDAFQNGDGALFLISLKAGGSGINLTGADYVLHLDPWWNPAVEDQATDRAHRIGQEKPVTVYRLVSAGTIEEKILLLHEQKRDLADALLAGTGASAKLSAEALMELIKAR